MASEAIAEAFFLPVGGGQRFCIFHRPHGAEARAALIFLHPFGEEMNKSRRMAALQARALAAAGYAVLCGEDDGARQADEVIEAFNELADDAAELDGAFDLSGVGKMGGW